VEVEDDSCEAAATDSVGGRRSGRGLSDVVVAGASFSSSSPSAMESPARWAAEAGAAVAARPLGAGATLLGAGVDAVADAPPLLEAA